MSFGYRYLRIISEGVFVENTSLDCIEITRAEVEQMIKERATQNSNGVNIMTVEPITKAKEAADNLIQAEKDYQEALKELQGYLGEGFKVTSTMCLQGIEENVVTGVPEGVDVSNPRTWNKGDVIVCIDTQGSKYVTLGKNYTFGHFDKYNDIYVEEDDAGDRYYLGEGSFEFVSRPV